jgi:hypothetical protein
VLMLKVAAAFLLLLGSGLIFHALVAMDAPTFHPRLLKRRPVSGPTSTEPTEASLRRAA